MFVIFSLHYTLSRGTRQDVADNIDAIKSKVWFTLAHQSMKTWFLNLVVTRDVFSKCPRHCAFVSVSNAHARD